MVDAEQFILHHRQKIGDRQTVTSVFAQHDGRVDFTVSSREHGRTSMRILYIDAEGTINAMVTPQMAPDMPRGVKAPSRHEITYIAESNNPELIAQVRALHQRLKGKSAMDDTDAEDVQKTMDAIIKALPMEQCNMSPALGYSGR